jgi:hypothetical protein
MADIILRDPTILDTIKKDPARELQKLEKQAIAATSIPSTMVYKMIVGFLGGVAAAAVIGTIVLAGMDKGVPEILIAVGSAAIGALAGTLVPASTGK